VGGVWVILEKEILGSGRLVFKWRCVKQNNSIDILGQLGARRRISLRAIMAKQKTEGRYYGLLLRHVKG
jgi:hypothetical protein